MEITYDQINREFRRAAMRERIPFFGSFELTSRCNLDCKMCYIRKAPNDIAEKNAELTASQWIEIARQATDMGMFNLLLTGGEVFLRPDIFELLDGLNELGLKIGINTNATLVTKDIAKRLAEYPSVIQLAVSIYGASAQTYESVSGLASGYEKTLAGIKNLKETGHLVGMRTTIIKQNREDLERMFEIAEEIKVPMRLNVSVFPCLDGVDNDPFGVRLTTEEQVICEDFHYRKRLEMLKGHSERQREKEPEHEDLMSDEDVDNKKKQKSLSNNAFKCSAGNYGFTVSPKGVMRVCMLLDEPSVPLLPDMDFGKAWERIKELADQVPECGECLECDKKNVCKPCPARLKGESGYFDRKAEFLCEKASLLATGKYLSLGNIH